MNVLLAVTLLATPGIRNRNEPPVPESGDWAVLLVSTAYPRADAATVADTIAAPLEQQLNGISGLKHIVSESKNDGSYSARLLFENGTDTKAAIELAEQRVALATPILPEIVQKRKVSVKVDDNKSMRNRIVIALMDQEARDAIKVPEWGQEVVKKLDKVEQIKKATAFPAKEREKSVRIDIDRAKCKKMGVPLTEVFNALSSAGQSPSIDKLKSIKITTDAGLKVPLGALVAFRTVEVAPGVCRVDLTPAILVTADIREGDRQDELASKCMTIAIAEMNRLKLEGYEVKDLSVR